ncbi:MAG: hypothetical protein M1814_004802 [Vezdaea aestivalis]|nr:MAG: hypothetical protein M1814_004802 [Vezdaea aestivalis]
MPKAIAISQIPGKPGSVYYPLSILDVPKPTPGPDEVVVQIFAAALNHRDLFIRQHLYPGVTFGVPLLADGAGKVVSAGDNATDLLGKRVILYPGRGWESQREGPERAFSILGGTKHYRTGTLAEFVVLPAVDVVETPGHLDDVRAAALPLTGLTAWRAVVTKSGNAERGRNLLITGIGGGVAIMALLFGVSRGCNVFVSSGVEEKIQKAMGMGAKGGVNYREDGWETKLKGMLPPDRPFLDAVIDGAGGDGVVKLTKLLKPGGIFVSYGMTLGPSVAFPMSAVLNNVELRGSTMGSRAEFIEMVDAVGTGKICPVVSRVVRGTENLDGINGLFEDMKQGKQFGKLVIELSRSSSGETKL